MNSPFAARGLHHHPRSPGRSVPAAPRPPPRPVRSMHRLRPRSTQAMGATTASLLRHVLEPSSSPSVEIVQLSSRPGPPDDPWSFQRSRGRASAEGAAPHLQAHRYASRTGEAGRLLPLQESDVLHSPLSTVNLHTLITATAHPAGRHGDPPAAQPRSSQQHAGERDALPHLSGCCLPGFARPSPVTSTPKRTLLPLAKDARQAWLRALALVLWPA